MPGYIAYAVRPALQGEHPAQDEGCHQIGSFQAFLAKLLHALHYLVEVSVSMAELGLLVHLRHRRFQPEGWEIDAVGLPICSPDIEESPLPFLHGLKWLRIGVVGPNIWIYRGSAALGHNFLGHLGWVISPSVRHHAP